MARMKGTFWSAVARRLSVGTITGCVLLVSACGRDAPLHPRGAALPPDAPSALLNPLCTGSGGQTHTGGTISTAVTWPASGNPHTVTGTVTVGTGGTLTIEPGAIVCFDRFAGLNSSGGRLVAQGLVTTPIVLTARDPALGWFGVFLQGSPPSGSLIKHARVEYTGLNSTGISSFGHLVFIDSSVVRQSGAGVRLEGRASRFGWSRVDTTTNRSAAAVVLGDSGRLEYSVVLNAAGTGVQIDGTAGVRLAGARIENSGGVGIRALNEIGVASASPHTRVVGGSSYPIETTAPMLRSLYGASLANQDSLKGNARDTVLMMGGTLTSTLYVRAGLPWHVKGRITVGTGGTLRGQPGSRMVLDPSTGITATGGGTVLFTGTRTSPVVITADDPARGWEGILLEGAPASASAVTNTRVEHVKYDNIALAATGSHAVRVDSAVFRQNGRAISLMVAGAQLSRTRVDTTLNANGPAVELGGNTILESTLIRGSSKHGLAIRSPAVQVLSCEVRESVMHGIVTDGAAPVHNCNLVNNLGNGVHNPDPVTVDATNNWWGDAGGPTAPAGDGVAGLVTYSPWRTTPFVLPYVP